MEAAVSTAPPSLQAPAPGMTFEQWVAPRSVYEMLKRTAKDCGGKTAITSLATDLNAPPRKLSYQDLLDGVTRAANAFRGLGLRRPDVVAYMLPSLPETQFVIWGAATAATALPLNPLLQAGDIASLCRAAGAKALVALGPLPGTEIWQKARQVKESVPEIETLLHVGGDIGGDTSAHDFGRLLQRTPAQLSFSDLPGLDDAAAYFHTGGTTGSPKLVIHTHRNELAGAFGGALAIGASRDDVLMNGLPMFHVGGAIFCSLSMFAAGAEVLLLTPAGLRNPQVIAGFWRIAERHGVTMAGGVPTSLSAAAKVDPAGADLSKVRVIISGAALLPRSVAEQLERSTGKPVRELYGMTETGGVTCVDPVSRARVIGSAGCPIAFCEVQARALQQGSATSGALPPGQAGVLVVKGPNVTPGYKDPAQSRNLFTSDGWLVTGDVGYVDGTGRVFITGRAKDLIIRSGHNIDPAVIEECLMSHPAVADAAVGMPDSYAGEIPAAYVTLKPGQPASEAELLAFAKTGINEPPALPKRIFVVDSLPMTAVGKIYKPRLRQDCAQRHLLELLEGEPVESLAVDEDPQRGRVVRIRLREGAEHAEQARARIAAALKDYLLVTDWISPTGARSPNN